MADRTNISLRGGSIGAQVSPGSALPTTLYGPTTGPAAQVAHEDIPAGYLIAATGSVRKARAQGAGDTGQGDCPDCPVDCVYVCLCPPGDCDTVNNACKCCYNTCSTVTSVLGLSSEPTPTGKVVPYVQAGPVTLSAETWDAATGGIGGLVPRQIYYLSQTEPGRLTTVFPANQTVVRVGIALTATTLNVQIASGQTDGYTLLSRPPAPGPYSVSGYGFATGRDLKGVSGLSWQLAATNTLLPGTPVYKNLTGGTGLAGQAAASAAAWLSSHVLGLTTPTPPMAATPTATNSLNSFISGGLFEMTEDQWDAVWTATDPNRGEGIGLLPGYPYYLSDVSGTSFLIDMAGHTSVGIGHWRVKCFTALSSTQVLLQISDPQVVVGA